METSQFVCIIGTTIAVYIGTMIFSFVFLHKKIIQLKPMLFGVLIYFIARGFLIPIVTILLKPVITNYINYITLILVILSGVFMKVILYPLFFKKSPSLKNYVSAGFGEGLTEAVLSIFPVFTNALAYCMKIQDGSIYTFFSKAYNGSQIQEIVNTFINTPNSYYIYMALSVIFIIIINVFIAYMIFKKDSIWKVLLVASILFIINIVLPSINYIVYSIAIIGISILFFANTNKLKNACIL